MAGPQKNDGSLRELLRNKEDVEEFEKTINAHQRKVAEELSYETDVAEKVVYLRWAVTDPTGRQALFFKAGRRNRGLDYDEEGEFLSSVWYNLFLENREHYLTEHIWKYIEACVKNTDRTQEHFIFRFTGEGPQTTDAGVNLLVLPVDLLPTLDPDSTIHNKLTGELPRGELGQKDLYDKIMSTVRRMRYTPDVPQQLKKGKEEEGVVQLQRKGIRKAIKKWVKDRESREKSSENYGWSYLDQWFEKFYGHKIRKSSSAELVKEVDADPVIHYELASNFLFGFQNIAILFPNAQEMHVFAYAALNGEERSSVTFFFKSSKKEQFSPDTRDKIFSFLRDIESAVPCSPRRILLSGQNYKLWTAAFNRLKEKNELKRNKQTGE